MRPARVCPTWGLCALLLVGGTARAEEFFNPSFLSSDPAAVADLSRFEKGESAPGTYRVEVYLNDEYVATQDMVFQAQSGQKSGGADGTGLSACITRAQLERLDVNVPGIPALAQAPVGQCVALDKAIAQAGTRFDFDNQRLYISVPQAALRNNARGYISPEEWDEGIPAVLLNYNFSGSNTKNSRANASNNSYFLNLNSGANVGAWRLRNYSTWSYGSGNGRSTNSWKNVSTYVQRSIIPLKSALVMGDSYTPSDVFDSLGFRGVQLASDDNMLPDSQRGFAPTVRGIARGNAKVTIKQNGYVIYQTYVSPGAFEITDLYPTSTSGDLQVAVTESDGSVNRFSVPYSAVPVLQREGRVKYALTAAQYRGSSQLQDKPTFGQGTLIWGLPNGVTVYGGSQLASNYRSLAVGAGKNLGNWGAISADITQANSTLADDSQHQGQSMRFLYAKSLNDVGTNFQLLGYRYSTQGFYTLDETSYRRMSGYTVNTQDGPVEVTPTYADYYNLNYTKKGKLQVNITQQLGVNGSLFLTGSRQTYWRTDETNDLWQAGYNGSWNDVSYSVSMAYNKSPGLPEADKRLALNVSLPLGKWLSGGGKGADITSSSNSAYATYASTTDSHGRTSQQAGVSGTLLADNNLSYSVQQGYGNHGVGGSGSAGVNYQGGSGNANAGYNYGRGYQQVTYGLSGGVVAHANGVTLSQPLGDTNVLIKAPGADGVNVENATGVRTDWRGYAVVPYATTYRRNRVALDPTTLKDNADLDDAVVNVVPTQGALVRADFATRIGVRALLTLTQGNGKPVPFGATVAREDGSGGSIVGDNGQVYLSGLPVNGRLKVVWGGTSAEQCVVPYALPAGSENKAISYAKAGCR
ncbi:fimbrial biogenesis usher protein [Klebsiella michiganensis]|jgi:outer membrane usher protein|nr:fimbrial biogenesis usher protein [Klebsiella michiganensis]MDL4454783.1 fimbrial biogenesis usher protein [Klebsiella michiganensis]